MQHEVLLAALGMPGDVIVPAYPTSSASSASSGGMTYAVAPDITFLCAGAKGWREGKVEVWRGGRMSRCLMHDQGIRKGGKEEWGGDSSLVVPP